MNRKSLSGFALKDADQGSVTAIFATLNEVDHDGDVTLPGAFTNGQEVVLSAYGHASSYGEAAPVGKGTIHADEKQATFDGQFFLDTSAGRDTFTVVKRLAESGLGEWSYGYEITDASYGRFNEQDVQFLKGVNVFEVSPVMRGAGIGTRTLGAKGLKFHEEGALLVAQLDAFLERASEVMALRSAKGGGMSPTSAGYIRSINELGVKLAALLTEDGDPPDSTEEDAIDVAREYARFVQVLNH